MDDLSLSKDYYKKYIKNLAEMLPDGVIQVDIDLLHRCHLLNHRIKEETFLTRYFHVIEDEDHMTLINTQFVVWIIPQAFEGRSHTLVLIALNEPEEPKLELAYMASDVYNTSKFVLHILDKFLSEIQETEELLESYRQISE